MSRLYVVVLILVLTLIPFGAASAAVPEPVTEYEFTSPLFGLASGPADTLFVADSGTGIVELRNGQAELVAQLPGVFDVAPIGRGAMFAITGQPDSKLYRISRFEAPVEIADLGAFEATVNPDPVDVNPNPYDVEVLNGGKALVADAGGNDLLIVDMKGDIDWIATLPREFVSTDHLKSMLGCPGSGAPLCGLPPMMPAQAVATSIAIGPDGAYYMGELKGFPAPTGESRIWRIEPDARNVHCSADPIATPECKVVADGFTSIVDLSFGTDGMLYVTELDEGTWFAIEFQIPNAAVGGTVNKCNPSDWTCTEVADELSMPTATAMDRSGNLYATISALIPDQATVVKLP